MDCTIKRDDQPAYLALLSDPTTTHKVAKKWLIAHGYVVGDTALRSHRTRFLDELRDIRRAAEMASAFALTARTWGADVLTDATVSRAEQILMEQLFNCKQADGDAKPTFTPKEWGELNRALKFSIENRRSTEAMKAEFDQMKKRTVAAVDEACDGKSDGLRVANRVREILGIPLDDLP